MQKYGLMANAAEGAQEDAPCVVCGENAGFNWSDLHGEGMCNRCGTPYNLKEKPRKIQIKAGWIPVLKRYWEETGEYMGLGTILIERDYPEAIEGRERFWKWCDHNKNFLPEKEEEKRA